MSSKAILALAPDSRTRLSLFLLCRLWDIAYVFSAVMVCSLSPVFCISFSSYLPTTAWHASVVWQARGNSDGERSHRTGPGGPQSPQGYVPRRNTDVGFPVAQSTDPRELS